MVIFVITLLLTSSKPIGLTIEVNDNTQNITIPHKVNIALWGLSIYHDLINYIADNLPNIIFQEEYDPISDETKVITTSIEGNRYHIKNTIEYEIDIVFRPITEVIDQFQLVANIGENNGLMKTTTSEIYYSGWRIPISEMKNVLNQYETQNDYPTIHLFDLAPINGENTSHWYSRGSTVGNYSILEDMQNMGYTNRGDVFYDISAIAPKYGQTSYSISNVFNNIVQIIENLVIGSPYSINQLPLEHTIHVANIIIAEEASQPNYQLLMNIHNPYSFDETIINTFPYLNVTTKAIYIKLSENPQMKHFITDNIRTINGKSSLVFNINSIEKFKNIIRDNELIYQNRPIGWFYSITEFVLDEVEQIYFESENGLVLYEYGREAFGTLNLNEWANQQVISDSAAVYLAQLQLNLLGKMWGLPSLNGFTAQLESSLSQTNIPLTWNREFSSRERENIAIDLGTKFNRSAFYKIVNYRNQVKNSIFYRLDVSGFDLAEKLLIEGTIEFYRHKYLDAAKLFLEGYFLTQKTIEGLLLKVSTFYNSINVGSILILFYYLISYLNTLPMTKEQLLKKLRKYNNQNNSNL